MRKIFLAALSMVSYTFLMGCGTQGPLYIPEQRYPQKILDEVQNTPVEASTEQTTTE